MKTIERVEAPTSGWGLWTQEQCRHVADLVCSKYMWSRVGWALWGAYIGWAMT